MKLFAVLSAAVVGGALLAGAASAQEVQERTIRWGHLNNTDHPVSFGVQKFAEILLAKSGGKLKVREFASSQLGNELQQQSALRGGTQEMLSASTTSLATVIPEFGLLDFPFIVKTTDQADALVQGAFGKAMIDALPPRGLVGLGYWGLGFRNVTNSKHPIAKLEDFAGLKLRVIPNPVYLESFSAFKANPIPMAFGELYSALDREHHHRQQDLLGQAVAGRAEDDAGGLQRKPRLPEGADAAADRKGALGIAGQGHDVQRGGAGRAGAHAQGRPASGREDFRGPEAGNGQAVQRRA